MMMPDFGKYAVFVWPSFGLTLAVMATVALASWRQVKAREKLLARLEQNQ